MAGGRPRGPEVAFLCFLEDFRGGAGGTSNKRSFFSDESSSWEDDGTFCLTRQVRPRRGGEGWPFGQASRVFSSAAHVLFGTEQDV